MRENHMKPRDLSNKAEAMVSLAELENDLAASRTAIRRWLKEARIPALVMGNGRNASIRFYRSDIDAWLRSRERID